ncbi:hypothetical protein [Niallia alba]|uniref:Uncharacterized protein n=1 Tax=Niallia alba TaxID=2729105 RepID=A0A7Y0K4M2_9BACI|nr:hypothetical protein [Niallia alba]NMO75704.1 hypothetical protein [Niallia alba]
MFGYFEIHLNREFDNLLGLPIDVGFKNNQRVMCLMADLSILELLLTNINRNQVDQIMLLSNNSHIDIKYYQRFKEACKRHNIEYGIV